MKYGIGIDTGGTYTDAVIYDLDERKVLAKGKSPTTREDLSLGIGRALDLLPTELVARAELVALSTTLATNACVENKGGRARLVLMGTTQETLEWIGADKKYGLNYGEILCLDTKSSYDGRIVDQPDWDEIMERHDEFFRQAEALSVAEVNSLHNGAVLETAARDALTGRYRVPFVMASELVSDKNVMERGSTALLNARLLPVVREFMDSVGRALKERGISASKMIVRSDGSLMGDGLAHIRPVETILSGPAASVLGSRALADCENCLIVDMGGTTTDISIIQAGAPRMTGGISIGGWRTQIKGVYIDTFGLGGDTRIVKRDGALALDTRRVEPICVAAAKWPEIKAGLASLIENTRPHSLPLYEFLYLIRRPDHPERYSDGERRLIERLEQGPRMIGENVYDMYSLESVRLENEGIVMRCGLTPTDVMHIRGDYAAFDAEASRLAARYFLRTLQPYSDSTDGMDALCSDVYDLVMRRLYENIVRVFVESTYPDVFGGGLDEQMRAFISRSWERRREQGENSFFRLHLDAPATLIGIGAPTHIFLPEVAQALGTRCVIPPNSGVANAVGAIVANVSAQASVEIRANFTSGGFDCYTIHANGLNERYEKRAPALEAAQKAARRLAVEEARRRGALGEIRVEIEITEHTSHARSGAQIDLGTVVTACVTEIM